METHTNTDTTETGDVIPCSQAVIFTGTFLPGEIHIGVCSDLYCTPGTNVISGMKRFTAGRIGKELAIGLSASLRAAGFQLGRLQTGTPVRLDKSTIDFSSL